MMRRAFTLIEALIAIALLAVVLPVAMAGVARAGQAAGAAHRQQVAMRLAQGKMNWLTASGDWSAGSSSGGFDPAQDGAESAGFRWQLEVASWRDPAVRQLHLTVAWDPASPANQVSVDTLVTPAAAAADTENP